MPANVILINNTIEYIVPDSRMDDLLLWLEDNSKEIDKVSELKASDLSTIAQVKRITANLDSLYSLLSYNNN